MMGSLEKFRPINSIKTFGVEIECYPNNCPARYNTHLPFFYKTHDASLGFMGAEYISQPMPYDMLVKKIKNLHVWVGGWQTRPDCGLHIHVSKKYWPEKRAKTFVEFLLDVGDNRTMEMWFGRSTHFAIPRPFYHTEKYAAINTLHTFSYEFRVWKAGDLEWTLEALRRTRDIVNYQGAWTINALNKICNVSEEPQRVTPPTVVRVRRPAPTTLGDLLRTR